jgi:hypothetical protein
LKHLKSITFYLFLSLIVISAGAATYVYFNADEIKERVVRGLNAVVVSKIEVGKVSLSLFKRFPNTSLVLEHVTINDPVQQERFLCKDATVYLDFNSVDLILGNYNLNHIGLQADFVRLVKHASQWNYILWKQDSVQTSNEVSINLKSFDWKVDSLYLKVNGVYAESNTKGKLSFEEGLLSVDTELGFANVFYKQKKYTTPKSQVSVSDFNPDNNRFVRAKIDNEYLTSNILFASNGNYKLKGTCRQLKALGASLQEFDVPDLQGNIDFQFNVDQSDLKNPTQLNFDLKGVSWSEKDLSAIAGNISLPNAKALDLAGFDISGNYNGFDLSLTSTTQLGSSGKQILRLKAKSAILPLETDAISLLADEVVLNLSLPKLSQLNSKFELQQIDFVSGTLTGVHYNMAIQNQTIALEGNAEIENNSLVFTSENSFLNGKNIKVEALLPSIKPLLEKVPKLYLQLDVESEQVTLETLADKKGFSTAKGDTIKPETVFDYNIELVFDAKSLNYDRVLASDAYGSLVIRPGVVDVTSFSANTFDGKAYAKGHYNINEETLTLTGFVNNISAEKVLKTFDNFQQDYVSYTNCRGNVDVNFDLQSVAFWNNSWGYSKFNVHMHDAELKNLPFLNDIKSAVKQNKFAKFILNEDELFEKLSFINLQEAKANFVLKNETVYISDATFRSPEINLNSQGEYYASKDEVDFEFQLYIKDFFAKSVNEDNYYEPQTKGSKLKFYLRGDANDPDVGMMKRNKKSNDKNRPAFKPEKGIENTPKGSTIFVVEEGEKTPKESQKSGTKEEEKKKSGWFKKMLEKGGSLEDTSKVEFGIE